MRLQKNKKISSSVQRKRRRKKNLNSGAEHLNRIKTVYMLETFKKQSNHEKTFRISIQIFQVLMTRLRFFNNKNNSINNQNNDIFISFTYTYTHEQQTNNKESLNSVQSNRIET